MKIVVTGATGKRGRLVVEKLLETVQANQVVAAVRSPEKAADLAARGVEVRRADYAKPETLGPALAGADRVLLVSSNEVGQRSQQHRAVIDAAKKAGVKLLAYTSSLRADTSPMTLAAEHRATENYIRSSGLPYVFLRNGWYLENYTENLGPALAQGAMVGCADNSRSSAARSNLAEAAARVLTGTSHENRVYELADDTRVTMEEFAAEVARVSGKPAASRDLRPDQYRKMLTGAGVPGHFAEMLVDSDGQAAGGALEDPTGELRRPIGRPTTTPSDAIRGGPRTEPSSSRPSTRKRGTGTSMHDYDSTRRSWNVATRNHNAHKGDQAELFRRGEDVLFPEELALLGNLAGRRLVHLQCNAGQDSLCLACRGAHVLGVDLSDEAIAFARALSADTGIPADFVQAEVVSWMQETPLRFELAFASYGAIGWLPDLDAWAHGVARILEPGGRLVYVEFHPLLWAFDNDLRPTMDDYFAETPFVDPVRDYVALSGDGLAPGSNDAPLPNDVPAWSWQYGLAKVVDALARAGLVLETIREYPHSNGFRPFPCLVPGQGRTWHWPPGTARLPMMYGLAARRPG